MDYEFGIKVSLFDRAVMVADAEISSSLKVKIKKVISCKQLGYCHKVPKNKLQELVWIITGGGTYLDYKPLENEALKRFEKDMINGILSKDDFEYIKKIEKRSGGFFVNESL